MLLDSARKNHKSCGYLFFVSWKTHAFVQYPILLAWNGDGPVEYEE